MAGPAFGDGYDFDDGWGGFCSQSPVMCKAIVPALKTIPYDRAPPYGWFNKLKIRLHQPGGPDGEKYMLMVFDPTSFPPPALKQALKVMSQEQARFIGKKAHGLANRARSVEVHRYVPNSPDEGPRDAATIRAVVASLEKLDSRAFAWGDAGRPVYITVGLTDGTKVRFRLRHQDVDVKDVKTGHLLSDPPLPMALWRLFHPLAKGHKR